MPEEQRIFHIVTEALAIPVGIYLIWLGQTKLKRFNRLALTIIGTGNIIIDGYLLLQWFK